MGETPVDVAVVGTGAVGLAAALAFHKAGFSTRLVGPEPERRDGRTAALLDGSVALLERLGVWAALRPGAGALRTMRIVDDTDSLFRPPPVAFRAAEIGLEAFGWNIENAALAAGLGAAARASGLDWSRALVTGLETAEVARLALDDGSRIEAALVVAADGRGSRLRAAASIATRERRYPQTAFTTLLGHELEHDDVSTEFHTRSGPFTLVPLPGRRSSLVWVTTPQHAARLIDAERIDLERAVEIASHSLLGRVSVDGPRGAVPLSLLSVDRMYAPRLALVGEAAHTLPPIGAQGLNLGFADVIALVEIMTEARQAGDAIGGETGLARYGRRRLGDVRLRSAAVDGLNRALLSAFLPVDALRGVSLGLLARIGPLRRAAMRAGMPARPSAAA